MSDQNHEVQVVQLKSVRAHPNADRLQLCTIFGNQVVIGLDAKDGDIGLYFNCDLQLSDVYASSNDLIKRKDSDGNPAGGMFEENRRVKCQKLRGEASDGFFAPISTLSHFGDISKLKVGDSFSVFNKTQVCNKYIVKTRGKGTGGLGVYSQAKKNPMFNEHKSTSHVGRNVDKLVDYKGLVVITDKLHGTSQRYGRVLVERELSWIETKMNQFLGKFIRIKKTEWGYLNGTRRVVLKNTDNEEQLRDLAIAPFKDNLHKGEVVYFEVVGYTPTGRFIMPPVDTKKMRDKEFTKNFANSADKKTMEYRYGCKEGAFDIYVYRISTVNESGKEVDLTWDRVKARCSELGVKHVPERFVGTIAELVPSTEVCSEEILSVIDTLSNGSDIVDPTHIREGVCVRLDSSEWNTMKYKSFTFKTLESIEKDSGVVNMEDQA